MTFEELKAEAKRQGYNLIKQPTYIPLKPCICGAKRSLKMCYTNHGRGYRCYKCGRMADGAKNNTEARINWNKLIELENNALE